MLFGVKDVLPVCHVSAMLHCVICCNMACYDVSRYSVLCYNVTEDMTWWENTDVHDK